LVDFGCGKRKKGNERKKESKANNQISSPCSAALIAQTHLKNIETKRK
jgi:hypothetical protein